MELLTVIQWQLSVWKLWKDVFGTFWTQKDHLSSRSNHVGLKYAIEGYIKDSKINMVDSMEVRVYRSQCKQENPNVMVVTDDNIQDQHCSYG